MSSFNMLGTGQVIQTIYDIVAAVQKTKQLSESTSLAEITTVAQVKPFTIVSQDLTYDEDMPAILQTMQSIFTAYYIQAVALQGNIDNVRVVKILDTLNPSRNASLGGLLNNLGKESLQDLLDEDEFAMPVSVDDDFLLSAESYEDTLPKKNNQNTPSNPYAEISRISADSKGNSFVSDVSNLCVGKLIDLTFTPSGTGRAITIPISIRLMVKQAPIDILTKIFVKAGKDQSFSNRYYLFKAGELKFWRDLVFSQDRIDEHNKLILSDKTGIYKSIQDRAANNFKAGMVTQNPSLADASNIYVVSSATAKAIEQELHGKFDSASFRTRVFNETYCMVFVVYDQRWKRLSVYTRGNEAVTELSISDIKQSNKGSGPDITAIFQALTSGGRPVM